MDTAGAVAGPLATVFLMSVCGLGYRPIFLIAAVPAALGILVLAAFVEERPRGAGAAGQPGVKAAPLSKEFRLFLVAYGLFSIGNSSDVFLLLKAAHGGLGPARVVLAYVLYNAVYAAAAAPAGAIADRLGRTRALAAGLVVFSVTYLGFARIERSAWFWLLFAVYGLYGALAECALKAAIAERCVPENRAAAMGLFQGVAGGSALAASLAAGWLWSHVSATAPFYLGAACAAASAPLLLLVPVRART
jgi:MFS family permease